MKRFFGKDDDCGAVAVVVAVMLVVLLGVAAVVVDAGAIYSERREMQTAADAAVLAGVQDLPANPTAAVAAAAQYVSLNTSDANQLTFEVKSTNSTNDTIVAVVEEAAMGLFFARVLGIESAPVNATATAIVGSPSTYGHGVMPFGIIANGTTASPYGYATGGEIPLVVDTGDQSQGNWHYVDLTPYTDGAHQTKAVISNGGTTDPISIGTIIDTQPGVPNTSKLNLKALDGYLTITCEPHALSALVYDSQRGVYEAVHAADGTPCNRLIVCPIIIMTVGDPYDWDVATGQEQVQVVGFVNMFVSNDPVETDGALMSTFVQVVPDDVMTPGPYIPYGGIMFWLES